MKFVVQSLPLNQIIAEHTEHAFACISPDAVTPQKKKEKKQKETY